VLVAWEKIYKLQAPGKESPGRPFLQEGKDFWRRRRNLTGFGKKGNDKGKEYRSCVGTCLGPARPKRNTTRKGGNQERGGGEKGQVLFTGGKLKACMQKGDSLQGAKRGGSAAPSVALRGKGTVGYGPILKEGSLAFVSGSDVTTKERRTTPGEWG